MNRLNVVACGLILLACDPSEAELGMDSQHLDETDVDEPRAACTGDFQHTDTNGDVCCMDQGAICENHDFADPPANAPDNFQGLAVRNADVDGSNFTNLNLQASNWSGSSMRDTDFTGANMSYANLARVDLTGANITQSQIDTTGSCRGATLPVGLVCNNQ